MKSELIGAFSLNNKGVVVVGAASGIGRQAAITFAQAGASKITIADVDARGLRATKDLIQPYSDNVDVVEIDVRNRKAVAELGAHAESGHTVDVWANVAGVISASLVQDTHEEELDRIVDINLKGVYWGCAVASAIMTKQGGGSIINISSAGADIPSPGLSVYAMTKSAVNMLTKCLAHEVGASGVRVNAVAPGFIDTPMVSYRFKNDDGEIDESLKAEVFANRAAATVLKRVGTPFDIALAMLYLASDASSFMTGQIIRPNGGIAMP